MKIKLFIKVQFVSYNSSSTSLTNGTLRTILPIQLKANVCKKNYNVFLEIQT